MALPTRKQANELLNVAHVSNPGPWTEHSRYAAQAAEIIGGALGLDAERCYIYGLLHDIGRYEGFSYLRHTICGYRYLQQLGFKECGRYCLTHSFWLKPLDSAGLQPDVSGEDSAFLESWLAKVEYDDYDRLIQLCDWLATAEGFCLVEQRIVDVALRYGLNEYSLEKWRVCFAVKAGFEKRIGKNIYALLPGLAQNITH